MIKTHWFGPAVMQLPVTCFSRDCSGHVGGPGQWVDEDGHRETWCAHGDCSQQVGVTCSDPQEKHRWWVWFSGDSSAQRIYLQGWFNIIALCFSFYFTCFCLIVVVKLAKITMFLFRESRRKTPAVVCLKENERLFGDSALGVVRVFLKLTLFLPKGFNLCFFHQLLILMVPHCVCNISSLWRTPNWCIGTCKAFWVKRRITLRWICTRDAFLSITCRRTQWEARFLSRAQSESLFHNISYKSSLR